MEENRTRIILLVHRYTTEDNQLSLIRLEKFLFPTQRVTFMKVDRSMNMGAIGVVVVDIMEKNRSRNIMVVQRNTTQDNQMSLLIII